jgi:hypothetical protein
MSSNWLGVVMNSSSPPQQDADPMEGVEKEIDECHLSTSSQPRNSQYLQHTPCKVSETNSSTHPQDSSSSIAVSRTEGPDHKPHKCEICGKGFRTEGSRKTHQKIVCQRILDYQCFFCNKKFGQKDSMANHIPKCHWNTESPYYKPHKCAVCDKGFSDAYAKNRHQGSICDGVKDYQCSFCDQKYSLQASVKRHIKIKHKEQLARELPSAIE